MNKSNYLNSRRIVMLLMLFVIVCSVCAQDILKVDITLKDKQECITSDGGDSIYKKNKKCWIVPKNVEKVFGKLQLAPQGQTDKVIGLFGGMFGDSITKKSMSREYSYIIIFQNDKASISCDSALILTIERRDLQPARFEINKVDSIKLIKDDSINVYSKPEVKIMNMGECSFDSVVVTCNDVFLTLDGKQQQTTKIMKPGAEITYWVSMKENEGRQQSGMIIVKGYVNGQEKSVEKISIPIQVDNIRFWEKEYVGIPVWIWIIILIVATVFSYAAIQLLRNVRNGGFKDERKYLKEYLKINLTIKNGNELVGIYSELVDALYGTISIQNQGVWMKIQDETDLTKIKSAIKKFIENKPDTSSSMYTPVLSNSPNSPNLSKELKDIIKYQPISKKKDKKQIEDSKKLLNAFDRYFADNKCSELTEYLQLLKDRVIVDFGETTPTQVVKRFTELAEDIPVVSLRNMVKSEKKMRLNDILDCLSQLIKVYNEFPKQIESCANVNDIIQFYGAQVSVVWSDKIGGNHDSISISCTEFGEMLNNGVQKRHLDSCFILLKICRLFDVTEQEYINVYLEQVRDLLGGIESLKRRLVKLERENEDCYKQIAILSKDNDDLKVQLNSQITISEKLEIEVNKLHSDVRTANNVIAGLRIAEKAWSERESKQETDFIMLKQDNAWLADKKMELDKMLVSANEKNGEFGKEVETLSSRLNKVSNQKNISELPEFILKILTKNLAIIRDCTDKALMNLIIKPLMENNDANSGLLSVDEYYKSNLMAEKFGFGNIYDISDEEIKNKISSNFFKELVLSNQFSGFVKLYLYSQISSIRRKMELANIDIEKLQFSFHAMKELLTFFGVELIYPRLFVEKYDDQKYKFEPRSDIFDIYPEMKSNIQETDIIIDLILVGVRYCGQSQFERQAVVSTPNI